jgi:hypothetical protein
VSQTRLTSKRNLLTVSESPCDARNQRPVRGAGRLFTLVGCDSPRRPALPPAITLIVFVPLRSRVGDLHAECSRLTLPSCQ